MEKKRHRLSAQSESSNVKKPFIKGSWFLADIMSTTQGWPFGVAAPPRSTSNGLKPTNFSPLFLLLSSFRTSQQVKITDVTRGTMNKSASVVCKYDCTIPIPASLALPLIPRPLPHGTAEPSPLLPTPMTGQGAFWTARLPQHTFPLSLQPGQRDH